MALEKFQTYLFVSAGEQSNKYLTPAYVDGIAQFQAQRAQELTGLTVRIDPIQEGTGNPSPTNIRPISGRTGMTVTRAGKNLLNATARAATTVNGITSQVYDNNRVVISGTSTGSGDAVINVTPFTIPAGTPITFSMTSAGTRSLSLYVFLGPGATQIGNIPIGARSITYTPTTDLTTSAIRLRTFNNGTVSLDAQLQIEIGTAATEFTPYITPSVYPITWESIAGTVYGGTLDVVSGVLTVTHGYILLDGTQSFRTNGRTAITQRAFLSVTGKAFGQTNIQSDRFAVSADADAVGKMNGRPASDGVEFYLPLDGTADTDASCKQWFADNNTQLVYELATPQTYQLTPTEVMTLAGFNQVYSDAGPVIDIKF